MNDERRSGTGHARVRYPLALGLVASTLLHLLLVVLNPSTEPQSYGRAAGAGSEPGAQFTVLSLAPLDEDRLIQIDAQPTPAAVRSTRTGTVGEDPADAEGAGRGTGADPRGDASVADRLRYNSRPFSAPVEPTRETENQRAIRETRERVLRAGEELGPLPPSGVGRSRAGGGGGIRIPFGFKPPPPAQTVPAPPLPDSILRQDSIRAAARAAARMDSLRAARDTTKLRNVAPPRRPVTIPRVRPDTTGD